MSLLDFWITLPTAPVTLPVILSPGAQAPIPLAKVSIGGKASDKSFDSYTPFRAYTSGTPNVIIWSL